MQRNLQKLANSSYDVLIIGGGIYGACIAWEAASRGLSVALVEKGDFGGATSANSLKIIHGGLRYLQHADLKRMRESIGERKNLLRIAPHLVHPLPILVPTYGHGLKGREAMSIALLLNDIISCDRNWSITDTAQHIPTGKVISKAECLNQIPGLDPEGLTGAALFTDAQVYNSERLTLAFLRSANNAGAQLANYAKVTGLLHRDRRITGATVCDEIDGQTVDIQARLVINTAGPWIHQLQAMAGENNSASRDVVLAKAINVVVPKLFEQYAIGLTSRQRYQDQDALIDKGGRFLFTVPWRHASMIGTWYFPFQKSPDELSVSQAELEICLDDINNTFPSANLSMADINYVHCGLLPSKGISSQTGDVQLTKHYQVIDHRKDGLSGLLTVSGVKYTTARDVAEKVTKQVSQILGTSLISSKTAQTPLFGGNLGDLETFIHQVEKEQTLALSRTEIQNLVYTYGTEYKKILEGANQDQGQSASEKVLASSVRYAIHEEMAQHLSDIVLRRTDIGSAGKPKDSDIELCANIMAHELNWDEERRRQELLQLNNFYTQTLPSTDRDIAMVTGR